jgi:hypothetical protein
LLAALAQHHRRTILSMQEAEVVAEHASLSSSAAPGYLPTVVEGRYPPVCHQRVRRRRLAKQQHGTCTC